MMKDKAKRLEKVYLALSGNSVSLCYLSIILKYVIIINIS